jgi:hypothetical protein
MHDERVFFAGQRRGEVKIGAFFVQKKINALTYTLFFSAVELPPFPVQFR